MSMQPTACVYHVGDVLDVLAALPENSVDLVLSSPPFLALRSYLPEDHPDKPLEGGSQKTPGEFVDWLTTVVEACDRVLAPHGSLAFELGDTYSGSGGAGGDYGQNGLREGQPTFRQRKDGGRRLSGSRAVDTDFAVEPITGGSGWPLPKSLALVPELFRLTLAYGINPFSGRTTDRWRVRNVVRWHRPNPPVGSLADKFRPSTSDMVICCKAKDRYFDLDAVREPHKTPNADVEFEKRRERGPLVSKKGPNLDRQDLGVGPFAGHPAGAPPLDTWTIPTQPEHVWQTDSGITVIEEGTAHRVRVQVGAPADGIQRTTSPDCPVHASPDHPHPTRPDDAHATTDSTHNAHTDAHPALTLDDDYLPTPSHTGPTDSTEAPAGPAATGHNTALNKTGHDHATNPSDTPSARTTHRIPDTPTAPALFAPHPDTAASNTSEAYQPDPEPRTESRTADTSSPQSACTCSYWIELDYPADDTSHYATWPSDTWKIPTQGFRGSHYATWPIALLERPIKAMSPQKVCVTCGEPSRRIVDVSYEPHGDPSATRNEERMQHRQDTDAGVYAIGAFEHGRATKNVKTVGWTDCGHNQWRPGLVLDPFAGSGTTLAAATGHGRSAIGIDLDRRNYDLARERVGMWLTESDL